MSRFMSGLCFLIAFLCFVLELLTVKTNVSLTVVGWIFISLGLLVNTSAWGWPSLSRQV